MFKFTSYFIASSRFGTVSCLFFFLTSYILVSQCYFNVNFTNDYNNVDYISMCLNTPLYFIWLTCVQICSTFFVDHFLPHCCILRYFFYILHTSSVSDMKFTKIFFTIHDMYFHSLRIVL